MVSEEMGGPEVDSQIPMGSEREPIRKVDPISSGECRLLLSEKRSQQARVTCVGESNDEEQEI